MCNISMLKDTRKNAVVMYSRKNSREVGDDTVNIFVQFNVTTYPIK